MTAWTAERIEQLKALVAERLSANQIAAELGAGLSRNAVIGKITRLGLTEQWTGAGRAPRTRTQARNDNRLGMRMRRSAKPRAAAPANPTPTPASALSPACLSAGPVRFLERRMHRECSAILNFGASVEELMCCGAPIPEGGFHEFCDAHRRVFLVAPEPRKRHTSVAPAASAQLGAWQ